MVVTAVLVTGAFASLTFVAPFLLEVSGLSPSALSPVLLVRGLAGLAGVLAAGVVVDRRPRDALALPVAVQAAALLALYAAGEGTAAGVVWTSLAGFSLSALATVLGTRVLRLAPGDVNVASATVSTAFNVGITCGALLGAALVAGPGLRSTALWGGVLSLVALAVAAAEWHLSTRSSRGGSNRLPGRARLPT